MVTEVVGVDVVVTEVVGDVVAAEVVCVVLFSMSKKPTILGPSGGTSGTCWPSPTDVSVAITWEGRILVSSSRPVREVRVRYFTCAGGGGGRFLLFTGPDCIMVLLGALLLLLLLR